LQIIENTMLAVIISQPPAQLFAKIWNPDMKLFKILWNFQNLS
jgi:hypothetical protein